MTASNVTILQDFLQMQATNVGEQATPFQLMVDHAPYGIAMLDQDFRLSYLNRQLARWADQSLANLRQQPLLELIHPDDRPLFKRTLQRVWQGQSYRDVEVRLQPSRGSARWVAVNLSHAPTDEGALVVHLADISRRKRTEQQLTDLATQDHLTGLANRLMFDEALNKAVKRAKRYQQAGAVLYIDLDKFKPINDQFGHHTGDAVLKRVAHIMQELFRDTDLCARIGGDEFAVIMDAASATNAEHKAQLLEQAISNIALSVEGERVNVSASVGVQRFDGQAIADSASILKSADAAMYQRKQA